MGKPEKTTSKQHLIFNLLPLILSLAGVIIGVTLFIVRPDAEMQKDIALIKQKLLTIETNHLSHLAGDIAENKEDIECLQDTVDETSRKVDRVLILMGENPH